MLQWDNGSTQQHQYSHCSRILSVALIVDQNLEIIQRMLLIVEPRLRYIEYSAPCDLSDRYISSHYSEHPAVLFSKISPPRFLVARTRFSLKLLLTLINWALAICDTFFHRPCIISAILDAPRLSCCAFTTCILLRRLLWWFDFSNDYNKLWPE